VENKALYIKYYSLLFKGGLRLKRANIKIITIYVTALTDRHLTYGPAVTRTTISGLVSAPFLYIASPSPFTPLVPYLYILNIHCLCLIL
jgi:hypothetical protein